MKPRHLDRSPRRTLGVALGAIATLAVAGCSSAETRSAFSVDDFTSCLAKAGVDVGADAATAQLRQAMSRAKAQHCALEELDAKDRKDLFAAAFHESTSQQRLEALHTYIDSRKGDAQQIAEHVGMLLRAQDAARPESGDAHDRWDRAWANERPQWLLAVAVYEHVSGPMPGLKAWVGDHGGQCTEDVVMKFIEQGERRAAKGYRVVEPIQETIDEVRDE